MGNKISATLMNKNTEVVKLNGEIQRNALNIPYFHIDKAEIINKKLAPPCIIDANECVEALNYWFKKRIISENRYDFPTGESIYWEPDSTQPHFFSMTDQYWVKYRDTETWDKYNFFTNNFKTVFGDTTFSKNIVNLPRINLDHNAPELTTNGLLKKKWVKENGKNYLIKSMSKDFCQEPLNEYLVSKLLGKINIIDFVKYELRIEGYEVCSICENFVNENTEFVPAWYLYRQIPLKKEEMQNTAEHTYDVLIRCIERFEIPHAKEFIDKMIIVDRLTMNFDRHLGNFGFLRDVNTGDYIGPAPLFDFGNAFFPESFYQEHSKKTEIFKKREKYLYKSGKFAEYKSRLLPNNTLDEIMNDLYNYAYLSDEAKKEINKEFCKNLDDVEARIQEYYKNSYNRNQKEQNFRMDGF